MNIKAGIAHQSSIYRGIGFSQNDKGERRITGVEVEKCTAVALISKN